MQLTHPLLAQQAGVYAAHQAEHLGLHRLACGAYPGTLVVPGVWSLLPQPFSVDALLHAALLHAGTGARLSGLTAAQIRGWYVAHTRPRILIVVPWARRVQGNEWFDVRRSRVHGTQVVCGWPLSVPARTVTDCVPELSIDQLAGVAATAIQRRELSLGGLVAFLSAHPRLPGVQETRRAVALLSPGADSVPEAEWLRRFRRWGLSEPLCQVEIYDQEGSLVCIADFWWDGIAVFYDGGTHLSRTSQIRDRRARATLETLFLQVVVLDAASSKQTEHVRLRLEAATRMAARRPGPDRWTARRR